MAPDDLSKKLHAVVNETDAITLHVAGATVRHQSPFDDLVVHRNAGEDLPHELIERWVMPFYLASLGGLEQAEVDTFARGASEITVDIVRSLLGEFNWRPRIAAAYFAAINGYRELEDVLGTHLLKSEVCYAGKAYCLAMTSFATEGAKRYLRTYLDYYLGRPDLWFDQGDAFAALEQLDPVATEALLPRWNEYVADKPQIRLEGARARLARALDSVNAIRRRMS